MPPTPWQTEIQTPGIWAGAVPRIWRTLSCSAYMPYMPECMYERPPPLAHTSTTDTGTSRSAWLPHYAHVRARSKLSAR